MSDITLGALRLNDEVGFDTIIEKAVMQAAEIVGRDTMIAASSYNMHDSPELDLTEQYMELRGISYRTVTDPEVLKLHARGQSMGHTPSRGFQVSKNMIIFTIEQAVSYNMWGRL